MPDATTPLMSPSVTVGSPTGPFDSDNLALLGLVKDSELEGRGPEQPSHKPTRTWAGTAFAVLALALGVAAIPVAIVHNLPFGAGLAGLGALLGIFGMFVAVLWGRGRGFGLSFVGSAVCGSFLFAAMMMLRNGTTPDDRRAQAGTPKQPHGDASVVSKTDPKEKPQDHGKVEVEAGGTGTEKGKPPDADKVEPPVVPAQNPGPIRLSGIRKQPEFFGRITSDLDLWKDNPVEADARWKGKLVEVEMNLNDLEIKTREDGLAFLLTEDTPFWKAAGIQHSAFVFSGTNRQQLVGLHKQEGTIVIRGKCEGLVRGRVTFEDSCLSRCLQRLRRKRKRNRIGRANHALTPTTSSAPPNGGLRRPKH
jgi:hypothetical protein